MAREWWLMGKDKRSIRPRKASGVATIRRGMREMAQRRMKEGIAQFYGKKRGA